MQFCLDFLKISAYCIVLLSPLTFSGCGNQSSLKLSGDNFYETIETVNYGSNRKTYLQKYRTNPRQVIVVYENTLEALLELGVSDQIAAAADIDFNRMPEKYQSLLAEKTLAVPYRLSQETAMMLQPDLIVAWYSTFSQKYIGTTNFWRERGVDTYILPTSFGRQGDPQTIEDEYRFIRDLGRIFKREDRAEQIIRKMNSQITKVAERTRDIERKPRCIIIEFEGKELRAYGTNTLGGNILMHLGVPLAVEGNHLTYEELIMTNPDVIFLVNLPETEEGGKAVVQRMYNMPAFNGINAVRNKRIYSIPLYEMYCSGVRTYDGILTFAHGVYPELFSNRI